MIGTRLEERPVSGGEMSRIFVINSERRDWKRRYFDLSPERRIEPREVTRRYVLIVDQPEIREVIKKEFRVLPHESQKDYIFYCIARPHCRRTKEFVKAIFYKLKKNNLGNGNLQDLEVLTA
jgi:hypothetical protein